MPVLKVKAASIFPFVSELLNQGQNIRLQITGDSMYPFLRDGIDSVEFAKGSFDQISRGAIVLVRRTDGYYVMHRVFKKDKKSFYMVGDAQQWIEGPLNPEQIIAVVTAIWRKDKRISCSKGWLRLLSGIWLCLRPYRYFIFRVYRRIRKY